jgi:hypothetical protein
MSKNACISPYNQSGEVTPTPESRLDHRFWGTAKGAILLGAA